MCLCVSHVFGVGVPVKRLRDSAKWKVKEQAHCESLNDRKVSEWMQMKWSKGRRLELGTAYGRVIWNEPVAWQMWRWAWFEWVKWWGTRFQTSVYRPASPDLFVRLWMQAATNRSPTGQKQPTEGPKWMFLINRSVWKCKSEIGAKIRSQNGEDDSYERRFVCSCIHTMHCVLSIQSCSHKHFSMKFAASVWMHGEGDRVVSFMFANNGLALWTPFVFSCCCCCCGRSFTLLWFVRWLNWNAIDSVYWQTTLHCSLWSL